MTFPTVVHHGAGNKKEADIITEALGMSVEWYDAYIEKHTYEHKRFTPDVTAQLAISRYEWLLSLTRLLALNRFSDEELWVVALSLQRELAVPNDYPLARTIADDNFILWAEYKQSKHCALIDKLLALTPLEDMALRDVIESYWHNLAGQVERFPAYIKNERTRLMNAALQKE